MKMAALSRTTGVSVPTLKYYLREGLLHPGAATAVNQADYDEAHVRRVRLVRALIELGHLSIADVAAVVAAVDDAAIPIHDAFGLAQDAMATGLHGDGDLYRQARALVDGFVATQGFHLRADAQVREMLADAFVHLAEFGFIDLADPDPAGAEQFAAFAALFKQMAARELASVPETNRSQMVEHTVVGTMAVEVAMAAIRRMALEDASERRFGASSRR